MIATSCSPARAAAGLKNLHAALFVEHHDRRLDLDMERFVAKRLEIAHDRQIDIQLCQPALKGFALVVVGSVATAKN